MLTLAIDTASHACSIALIDDGALIAERHEELGRGHAERLIPWIEALPAGGKAKTIVVGCGPGSFTGVRIGIAAARGLALGWNVPVFGVSSLHLMVADREEDALTIAVDAGHGELFVQDFQGRPLSPVGEVRSRTPSDAAAIHRHRIVLGSGAQRLVAERGWGTAIDASARAANARFVTVLGSPVPIYGRGADAKPMAAQAL